MTSAQRRMSAKAVKVFNALNPAMKKVLGPKPTKADGIAAQAVLTRMSWYARVHFELTFSDCCMSDDLAKALEATEDEGPRRKP